MTGTLLSMLVSKLQFGGAVQCSTLTSQNAPAQPRKATAQKLLRQISSSDKNAVSSNDNSSVLRFLDLDAAALAVPRSWQSIERRCIAAERGKRKEFKKSLSSRVYAVPHIVSTAACRCSLTGTVSARRFRNKFLNKYFADLFLALPTAITTANLPETTLSRYDLHHAHVFCDQTYGLGLLFHSKEYIVTGSGGDVDVGNLGNCQVGTPLEFEREAMAWRNTIW